MTSFTETGLRGNALTWREGLVMAREECATHAGDPTWVASVPQDRYRFFIVRLPCDDLGP